MLTVVGSVASKCGPREVTTGNGVGASVPAGAIVAGRDTSKVGVGCGRVRVAPICIGCVGATADVAGAHAANKAASRVRLRKTRSFVIFFLLISGF